MNYLCIIAGGVLILWNIITFSMYYADKRKAEKNKWRIKERTLILIAFLMGGIGALLGMYLLRHKTQHTSFKLLVPIGLVLNLLVIAGAVYFFIIR
ncbi:MAG: DUF1294 domain-containing protein [Defluviitaleaceae bacterium]|nr:DUF1294 domain-containing protein [Defluviitaleaceae bacterium]